MEKTSVEMLNVVHFSDRVNVEGLKYKCGLRGRLGQSNYVNKNTVISALNSLQRVTRTGEYRGLVQLNT